MAVRHVVLVVMLLAACGGTSSGSGGANLDPDTLVGQTEQGLRMRIAVVDDSQVELRLPIDCASGDEGGGAPVSLHRHPLRARVDADGSFRVDAAYVEDGTDGDAEHVDVRVEGVVEDDGRAVGTVDVEARWWNGQAREFGRECDSGVLEWAATEPLRHGSARVSPGPAPALTAAVGPDLLTVSAQGEVARLDGATGEARRLDGSTPSGPASSQPGGAVPGGVAAPATVVAPGPGASVLAVAAGGVWSTDPATGVPQRTELADGRRAAALEAPVESLVAGPGEVWTVRDDRARATYLLERRDPVTGAAQASVPVTSGTLSAGPGGVWYAYRGPSGGRLERIDPGTAEAVESYPIDPDTPSEMVVTHDRVWMAGLEGLSVFDPASGHRSVVDLASEPGSMARTADGRGIWVAHEREAVIRRVEATGVVRTVDVPEGRWRLTATDDGAVWLTGGPYDAERIVRLGPSVTGG